MPRPLIAPTVPLRRLLLLVIALVLIAFSAPVGVIVLRRIEEVLVGRVKDELSAAPHVLVDRQAATADALMMHAKDLAHTPGLAAYLVAGDSSAALLVAERARNAYADAPVLMSAAKVQWGGLPLPPEVVEATTRGQMPVTLLSDGARVEVVAVAPVIAASQWVGLAGLATRVDLAEAERLAGLTRAEVLILAGPALVATTLHTNATALAAFARQQPADGVVRELTIDGERYAIAVVSLSGRARVAFVRDLRRELAIIADLRRTGASAAALALAFALLLGVALAHAAARPVRELARAADQLAAGDFLAPLQRSRIEEIDRLAAAFSSMRHALKARLQELEDRQARLTVLQAELIQRDRLAAAGRLVVQLAHEIRNPVASIRNCLELIRRRHAGDADSVRYASLAVNELLRMHSMADQLLDLHRPRTTAASHCEPCVVAHEVRTLLAIDSSPTPPAVRLAGACSGFVAMSPDVLKQVLLNLCDNAREALAGPGAIELRLVEGEGTIAVEVRDTGPGIPLHDLPRIFDPFFTTKSAVHGVGLGLFVAEGLVRSHGGALSAANRSDERGAVFTVTLPRAAGPAASAPPGTSTQLPAPYWNTAP